MNTAIIPFNLAVAWFNGGRKYAAMALANCAGMKIVRIRAGK
jgi:hypothetical protein